MPLNYRNKNNFNIFNIDLRLHSFFFFFLLLFTIYLIIKINNASGIITRDKIPVVLNQIETRKDQKVIALKNRDKLLRTHIKDEAKKNGMIKANYSRNIIKW